jgi:FlgD Ig-like domain
VSSSALARVVFLALVAATVGAFFVTQRLKRSGPVVKRLALPLYISPNGDGRKDTAHITFNLPKSDTVTIDVVNGQGDVVRRLLNDVHLHKGFHALTWDGRATSGRVPRDGYYFVRVGLRREGRAATGPRGMQLVTKPPRPRILSVTPGRLPLEGARRPVTIRFTGPASPPPVYTVFRTDGGKVRQVAQFTGTRSSHVAQWDGLVNGKPAPEGLYTFAVTVENRALVAGSWPHKLPPTDRRARPGAGVTISGLNLAPPLEPVAAGGVARVGMSAPSRVHWDVTRLGSRRPLARGRGGGGQLAFRLPRRAATGLYVVHVRGPGRPASAPLAVRGGKAAGAKVLVVLPAISWQGQNQVDDDGDGFADTLDGRRESVGIARPFALGAPPPGFAGVAALLRFLDQHRLGYDITTDLALAYGRGPQVAGHRGVLFPGSERWLTPTVQLKLRNFTEAGGRVAWFGTDAFRRSVHIVGPRLARQTPPQPVNVFGEGTRPLATAAAPLVVTGDRLGLFSGTDGFVGLFTGFEQESSLVGEARVLANAGRDPRRPAFVAYSLGKGTVVRVGTPAWTASLSDPEVASVTLKIWALLSQ